MRPLDQNQRRASGLTRRNKKTGLLTMPGYDALNDLVNRIDPVEPSTPGSRKTATYSPNPSRSTARTSEPKAGSAAS